MGILDEAIREHLELKRRHGAAETELRDLEDDAFGPHARPGQVETPEAAPVAEAPAAAEEETAIVEQPTAETAPPPQESAEPLPEPDEAPEPVEPAVDQVEGAEGTMQEPVAEEHPAMEHRTVDPRGGVEGIVSAETEEHPPPEPPPEPEDTASAEEPTELYEAEAEPPAEDEFFSEQSLSDELDQALDAPEGEAPVSPPEPAEPPPPDTEEDEPAPEEAGGALDDAPEEGEDVLEETPEFLQDTPEHDRLWFEQKPPKDFDFDD